MERDSNPHFAMRHSVGPEPLYHTEGGNIGRVSRPACRG